ncbi:hypothetical protein BN1708_014658, partial [Verticillium longisporum]
QTALDHGRELNLYICSRRCESLVEAAEGYARERRHILDNALAADEGEDGLHVLLQEDVEQEVGQVLAVHGGESKKTTIDSNIVGASNVVGFDAILDFFPNVDLEEGTSSITELFHVHQCNALNNLCIGLEAPLLFALHASDLGEVAENHGPVAAHDGKIDKVFAQIDDMLRCADIRTHADVCIAGRVEVTNVLIVPTQLLVTNLLLK